MLPCIKTNAFIDKSDSSDFGSDLQFPSYIGLTTTWPIGLSISSRSKQPNHVHSYTPSRLQHLLNGNTYLSMITWSEYDNACSIAALSNLESFTNRTALVSSPWLALTTHGYLTCSDSIESPVAKEFSKSIRFKLPITFYLSVVSY